MKQIIFVGLLIFITLAVITYLMLSFLTIFIIIVSAFLSAYFIFFAKIHNKILRVGLPSLLTITIIVLPAPLISIMAAQGYLSLHSVILIIVAYGLMLTLWINGLTIPLAIVNKINESAQTEKISYPPISVIIPAYNEEKVIERTIQAVLDADYPNKEIIVVDDGSVDLTYQIASRYADKVKLVRKENGGKSSALNLGLRFASGEIVVMIDADTVIGKDSLKEVVKRFNDERVVAVAGNVKVMNRSNWLTKCQALEYIISIQIMRRALDRFGAVTVVPGALGAFRRSILQETGFYDRDTLVEDFDVTVKALKTGHVVQASSTAAAYTQAPQTLSDLYRQRMRWYRGNFQTFKKHFNAFTNPRFGFLHSLGFPFMLLSMGFIPVAGLVVWASVAIALLNNDYIFIIEILSLFMVMQCLLAILSILIDGEDMRLALYAPFFVIGYKQIIDAFTIKAMLDVILHRKVSWTRAKRFG